MSEARDPETIQREIEQTRAQLAVTLDALAERASPKRAVSRGKAAMLESPRGRAVLGGAAGLLVAMMALKIVRRIRD
ncbi:MAG: DUF3618 domain-containing protein [Mycobacteriales bacterium]